MSALPPKADMVERDGDVRFVPKADILRCEIEQCAVGIKYTTLHTAKWKNVRHLILEPSGDVGEPLG